MNEQRLRELQKEYAKIDIPKELDTVMRKAIASNPPAPRRPLIWLRSAAMVTAVAVFMFVAAINAVPTLAQSLEDVPVLGPIVQVLTFTRLAASSEEQAYEVNIEVPEIQGMGDTSLQESLNDKYRAEAEQRYAQFMEEIGGLTNGQLAHKALDAGYIVKVQNGPLLVIEHWVVEVMASGAESVDYDNIDTERGLLLTLPGLFRDDSYVQTISTYIREEMKAQMAASEEKVYFLGEDDPAGFREIAADQEFYINADSKLVIVFDEYEVAPGFMGVVEFEIPTEVIAPALQGSEYIK